MDKMPWNQIKDYYAKHGTSGDRYFIDWIRYFSPIEYMAWQDIGGWPFMPQWPIGRVFVDFALPEHKVAVELDGKAYHDAEKDRKRDAVLSDRGWTVYRIPGREARENSDLGEIYREIGEGEVSHGEASKKLERFFSGSPGVFRALAWRYLGESLDRIYCCDGVSLDVECYAIQCLNAHKSAGPARPILIYPSNSIPLPD